MKALSTSGLPSKYDAKMRPTENLVHLPEELMSGRRFVCWQLVPRPNGKADKVPVSPHGGAGKSNDPSTWGDFMQAVNHCEGNNLAGIGIVLSRNNGDSLTGIDLDDCIDKAGNLSQDAAEIVAALNSYTEITPSGKGLRIFVKGTLPQGARRKGPIEMYDEGRYLTLTGNHLDGTPAIVEARQEELAKVWEQYVSSPKADVSGKEDTPVVKNTIPDDDLIDRASSAANGPAFKALYTGDWRGAGYPSQSEADLALCCHLAFWTGNDTVRIDGLFRRSGLYRDKWDVPHVQGRTYGEETIRKAVGGTREVYAGDLGDFGQGKLSWEDVERIYLLEQGEIAAGTFRPPSRFKTVYRNRLQSDWLLVDMENSGVSIQAAPEILSQIYTWDEIAALDISTDWLLDGIIPEGAITLIFCPGGGGKTWLNMQLAKAIAEGKPFAGLQTKQRPVYFVDFENPLSVVKERREKIGSAENFYYWHLSCPVPPPRLDAENWELYKTLPRPGLLIFDTLRASQGGDENSSKDMELILRRFKELREKNLTIIVLHHSPKSNDGTYKGSTAILDLADHVLSLERQGKNVDTEFDNDSVFKFGARMKTRFEPHSIYLSFDPAIGFVMRDDPDVRTMEIMKDMLTREGPLNQGQFRKLITEKLEVGKDKSLKLIRKGTGTYWEKNRKEENNAMQYSAL